MIWTYFLDHYHGRKTMKNKSKAKSHPTYNKKDKEINGQRKSGPYPGWWIFVNVPWKKQKTWIEQYRLSEY